MIINHLKGTRLHFYCLILWHSWIMASLCCHLAEFIYEYIYLFYCGWVNDSGAAMLKSASQEVKNLLHL